MALVVGLDLGSSAVKVAMGQDGVLSIVARIPATISPQPDGTVTAGEPDGHPMPDLRSRLGDPAPVLLNSTPYSVESLLAALVRRALAEVPGRPDLVVLTCPASWGPYRRERFDDVPVLAGIGRFQIRTEAEVLAEQYFDATAADHTAGDHTGAEQTNAEQAILIYDLGAQSLDVTVVRDGPAGAEILGTPGGREGIGGAELVRLTAAGADLDPVLWSGVQVAADALTSAGVAPEQLQAILLTGGASREPRIGQSLASAFAASIVPVENPDFAIALAAAELGTDAPSGPIRLANPGRLLPIGCALIAFAAVLALVVVVVGVVLLWPSGPGTRLLSQNQPVLASSEENPTSTAAGFAVDGDETTRWGSKFADPQWLQVDLGSRRHLSRVRVHWEAAFARAYQLQTSDDAKTWQTIYATTSDLGGVQDLTVTGTGRYLRLYGTQRSGAYGYSVYELQVFGH